MDRPETIELVGQTLRWRTEVPFYTHYKSDDGRAFVALSIYGDVDWEIEVIAFHAPLYSAVYQRQGDAAWVLVEKGHGFA